MRKKTYLCWFDLIFLRLFSFLSSTFYLHHHHTIHHKSIIITIHLLNHEIKKIKKMKNRVMIKLGCATSNLSQNMFFTGTIPLTDVMHQNHQSVAMTQNRTPPTLFQYPSKYSWCFYYYSTRCLLYFRAYAFY